MSLPPAAPWNPLPRRMPYRHAYLGWWIAGAVGLVAFSRVAFFNPILGVFIDPLQDEFGWSRATIAGAISLGTLVGAAIAPFLGPYVDRWGGRWIMVGAVVVSAVLLFLLAILETVWQFYLLFGLGRTIAAAVLDIAIIVTLANWFIRGRGRAMGMMLVGTRGGMALMPLLVLLFLSLADWRAAFAALGVLILVVCAIPAAILVRRRPEDVGLLPDGDDVTVAVEGEDPPALSADYDPRWSVRDAIRTRAFWFLLFGTAQLFLVGGAVNLTIPSHMEDNGLSQGTAVTVVTVWAITGIFGGVVGGELRQRFPIRFVLPAVISISSGAIVWLIFVDSAWMAYTFALWHGLAFGAQLPLEQIAFSDYFGRWSVGAIRGITAPVQFSLNAAGPLLAGLVFDQRGAYDLIYAVFVGLLLFGALNILLSSPPRHADAMPADV